MRGEPALVGTDVRTNRAVQRGCSEQVDSEGCIGIPWADLEKSRTTFEVGRAELLGEHFQSQKGQIVRRTAGAEQVARQVLDEGLDRQRPVTLRAGEQALLPGLTALETGGVDAIAVEQYLVAAVQAVRPVAELRLEDAQQQPLPLLPLLQRAVARHVQRI